MKYHNYSANLRRQAIKEKVIAFTLIALFFVALGLVGTQEAISLGLR